MKPRYERRFHTSRLRRTTVIDEARPYRDGTRACGMATICLANGLAGRTESMPRNVAWASVSATPMQASSRSHAGVIVDGSDNTGRGPTAVEDVISSSCRPSRRTTQTRTLCSRAAAGYSVRQGWWGQPRGGGGGGGNPLGPTEARGKKRRAPRGGDGRHVVGWEEERVGEHRVATNADGFRCGVV